MNKKLLYRDEAGNTLWEEEIKSRGTRRLFAKNREGRLVTMEEFKKLARRAGVYVNPNIKRTGPNIKRTGRLF